MKQIAFRMKDELGTLWTIKGPDDSIFATRDDVRKQLREIDQGKSKAKFLYISCDLILNVDHIQSVDVTDVKDDKEK